MTPTEKLQTFRKGVADYAAGREPTTAMLEYHEGYSAAARLLEAAKARFDGTQEPPKPCPICKNPRPRRERLLLNAAEALADAEQWTEARAAVDAFAAEPGVGADDPDVIRLGTLTAMSQAIDEAE